MSVEKEISPPKAIDYMIKSERVFKLQYKYNF